MVQSLRCYLYTDVTYTRAITVCTVMLTCGNCGRWNTDNVTAASYERLFDGAFYRCLLRLNLRRCCRLRVCYQLCIWFLCEEKKTFQQKTLTLSMLWGLTQMSLNLKVVSLFSFSGSKISTCIRQELGPRGFSVCLALHVHCHCAETVCTVLGTLFPILRCALDSPCFHGCRQRNLGASWNLILWMSSQVEVVFFYLSVRSRKFDLDHLDDDDVNIRNHGPFPEAFQLAAWRIQNCTCQFFPLLAAQNYCLFQKFPSFLLFRKLPGKTLSNIVHQTEPHCKICIFLMFWIEQQGVSKGRHFSNCHECAFKILY